LSLHLWVCFGVVLSCVGRGHCYGWSLIQGSPTKCLNKITKPPVWGGQDPYKVCRTTDDDKTYDIETRALELYIY
jgi:hypothetical protein